MSRNYEGKNMILQKNQCRKVNKKKYYKHLVVIPEKVIRELGWEKTRNLKYEVKKKCLEIQSL